VPARGAQNEVETARVGTDDDDQPPASAGQRTPGSIVASFAARRASRASL
jgi:hypothetical protein